MNPTDPPTLPDPLETNSSVFDKVPPDLRRQLNRALVDHTPPTYKAVFAQFKLAALGVSFHAFYRYARRLRAQAAMFELANLALPENADVHAALPRLLAQQLLETMLYEDVSPRHVQRLTAAYRAAVQSLVELRKAGLLRKQSQNDNADLADMLSQYTKLVDRQEQIARSTPTPRDSADGSPPAAQVET